MINNISWASYCYAMGVLLVIYYSVVLILFYRDDIRNIVFRSNTSPLPGPSSGELDLQQRMFDSHQDDGRLSPLGKLVRDEAYSPINPIFLDELNAFFQQAPATKFSKNELISSLRSLFGKHHVEIDASQKSFINKLVENQCIRECSIHLHEEDIELLWQR